MCNYLSQEPTITNSSILQLPSTSPSPISFQHSSSASPAAVALLPAVAARAAASPAPRPSPPRRAADPPLRRGRREGPPLTAPGGGVKQRKRAIWPTKNGDLSNTQVDFSIKNGDLTDLTRKFGNITRACHGNITGI